MVGVRIQVCVWFIRGIFLFWLLFWSPNKKAIEYWIHTKYDTTMSYRLEAIGEPPDEETLWETQHTFTYDHFILFYWIFIVHCSVVSGQSVILIQYHLLWCQPRHGHSYVDNKLEWYTQVTVCSCCYCYCYCSWFCCIVLKEHELQCIKNRAGCECQLPVKGALK